MGNASEMLGTWIEMIEIPITTCKMGPFVGFTRVIYIYRFDSLLELYHHRTLPGPKNTSNFLAEHSRTEGAERCPERAR